MEKILPSMFTPVKSVMCSKVDKIMVHENESLSEVNLLKGVKLIDSGYVCLAGLVVTGEWNLPDNCRKAWYRDWETDRKSTRLNSSHRSLSRMPSSA